MMLHFLPGSIFSRQFLTLLDLNLDSFQARSYFYKIGVSFSAY